MKQLEVQSCREEPPTRDFPAEKGFSNANLQLAESKFHPSRSGDENASILFVGTATTILLAALDVPLAKNTIADDDRFQRVGGHADDDRCECHRFEIFVEVDLLSR